MLLLALAVCTTATPACTERIPLGSQGKWSLIYRSLPLAEKNEAVTRAVVMVHGQGRNADDYFRTAMAAAFLAGAMENTLVVSPRFASKDGRGCQDSLAAGEISWRCSGDSWRSGAASLDDPKLTSYDFMDAILQRLADKTRFPNLKRIVMTGHSAGGQYAARYAMANKVHNTLGVPVEYVVSNPSSYSYLDATRQPAGDVCGLDGKCASAFMEYREGRNCTTYNQWPYGLEKRPAGTYTAGMADEQLRNQLASRPVTYLMSELDNLPLAGFDSSCPAQAQGPHRFARGLNFWSYMNTKFGAKHKFVPVPLCGHNARCLYTADPALKVLFPNP